MMKHKLRFQTSTFLSLLIILILTINLSMAGSGPLRVTENQRYLEYEDGTPFFYLGDTAWELFHRLNREEAKRYLTDRAEKGFTVIQAVVIAQMGGLNEPNPYGNTPLKDNDPTKPNEAYFEHVDYIVNQAEELGLYIGMLPSWGSYWKTENRNNTLFNMENAVSYGEFLGKRYKNKPIIWILGGDDNPQNEEERAIINAMAKGIKKGDGGRNLMTFHPRGPGLSSDYFHKADWLDFNMFQSSHGSRDHDNGLFTDNDYTLSPPKPTLDGEPRYETINVGFYFKGSSPLNRYDDYDVRQAAYWSLMAGACGHTYGNNNIWQMWQPGRGSAIDANIPWYEALDHPGAFQMGHVRKLFESRPFTNLIPKQEIIWDGPKTGGAKIRALCARDGSFAFIYSPRGKSFSIDTRMIKAKRIKEIWFDPRYGVSYHLHTTDTQGIQTYTPPTSGRGNDWILILEDKSENYPMP